MGGKESEACGRCSVSTAVDVAHTDEKEQPEQPFEGDRIEIEESTMRSVVRHEVFVGRVKDRLNQFAERVVFGRRSD